MLILRKDISEKIKKINLLIVNINIFVSESKNFDYGKIWEIKNKDIISKLSEHGVKVVAYKTATRSNVRKAKGLGIEVVELNGNRKLDLISFFKGEHTFRDMVVLGNDEDDIELIKHSRFSASTADAPLNLKMESQYVSNFSGLEAFEELGNIIINAKTNH